MLLTLFAENSVKLALAAALIASLALAPVARMAARRLGVVDKPDGVRKRHERPVPLWGGVAVYLALVAGLLVARWLMAGSPAFAQLSTTVILACGLVCLVGCVDDSHDLNARFKLLLQVLSVMPVVLAGYYFDRVVAFSYPIELGWLGIPLTILWLVGCINSLNLLDGLDGLASVVGICASVMMSIIAVNTGHGDVAIVALVLAGSLAGFLAYNLPPASIFLGDSGSMVIGLVVGMISMQGALKTSATLSIAVPAVVMSIPMLDTVFAIARRKLSGRPFDAADRGHIHHRLLERGLTNWQALCIIGALCLTTGAAATAATLLSFEWLGWITAIVLIAVLVRTRAFGHHEMALAREQIAAVWRRGAEVAARRPAPESAEAPTSELVASDWGSVWEAILVDETVQCSQGFELLLASRAAQVRYSWRHPQARPKSAASHPLVLAFSRPDGSFCQMHLLDLHGVSVPHNLLPKLTALLESLAHHWQIANEVAPPPGLGIEFIQVPVAFYRQAA